MRATERHRVFRYYCISTHVFKPQESGPYCSRILHIWALESPFLLSTLHKWPTIVAGPDVLPLDADASAPGLFCVGFRGVVEHLECLLHLLPYLVCVCVCVCVCVYVCVCVCVQCTHARTHTHCPCIYIPYSYTRPTAPKPKRRTVNPYLNLHHKHQP